MFGVFDDFSKWRVANLLQNSKKSSNIAKIWEDKKEDLANFTIILMPAFGTQIVHSALWVK